MISFHQRGDFKKLSGFLERAKEVVRLGDLDRYGRLGVDALRDATPKDTGETAKSWHYEIKRTDAGVRLEFYNDSAQDGVNIAVILQYGHATGTGGWVEGRDYINPAVRPIFDEIARNAWREVTRA